MGNGRGGASTTRLNGEGLSSRSGRSPPTGAVDLITDAHWRLARIGHEHRDGILPVLKVGTRTPCCSSTCRSTRQSVARIRRHLRQTVSRLTTRCSLPGSLLGQVTSVNEEAASRSVNVPPLAKTLHNLMSVQGLTSAAAHALKLSRRAAGLPPGPKSASGVRRGDTGLYGGRSITLLRSRRPRSRRRRALRLVVFSDGLISEVPCSASTSDLSPLAGAFLGLLCGSTLVALGGFASGCSST